MPGRMAGPPGIPSLASPARLHMRNASIFSQAKISGAFSKPYQGGTHRPPTTCPLRPTLPCLANHGSVEGKTDHLGHPGAVRRILQRADIFLFVDSYPDFATWAPAMTVLDTEGPEAIEAGLDAAAKCSENDLCRMRPPR